ncbi:MAG: nitrogenase component 1 [Spirochaetales bacterium]|nr:nitrogenase component 1 [Spirochaetales bacterium]
MENITNKISPDENAGAVVNACKTCAPLGASLAMKGIAGSMCILHGSQGCATYIRRYFISHFREPVDIASSSFSENTAVFGGKENLFNGIKNIIKKYNPKVIGIATTCLAETIGEDISFYVKELEKIAESENITFIHTDTAAYKGTHITGFLKMTAAAAKLAEPQELSYVSDKKLKLNIFPWMVSPGDIRGLKSLVKVLGISATFLPDYSQTMDGGAWSKYEAIPKGGTTIDNIKKMGGANHSLEFGIISSEACSPASILEENCNIPKSVLPLPIGLRATDLLINHLKELAEEYGCEINLSEELQDDRSRLLDAYADAHKYFSGTKAAVYGEADFVLSMASYLCEIGIEPAICMTGEKISLKQIEMIKETINHFGFTETTVLADSDFTNLDEAILENMPDLLIGNSKGYKTARKFGIPLVRAGFPIQDRFGGQRLQLTGYKGAQRLTDEIANTIIAKRQAASPVGYMSM